MAKRTQSQIARRILAHYNRVTGAKCRTLHELNVHADRNPEVFPKLGLPTPRELKKGRAIGADLKVNANA